MLAYGSEGAKKINKKNQSFVSMSGGGSGAAPAAESGGAGDSIRRLHDRLESMLPRVEALAADRARVEETNRAQHELLGALYAHLLQVTHSLNRDSVSSRASIYLFIWGVYYILYIGLQFMAPDDAVCD